MPVISHLIFTAAQWGVTIWWGNLSALWYLGWILDSTMPVWLLYLLTLSQLVWILGINLAFPRQTPYLCLSPWVCWRPPPCPVPKPCWNSHGRCLAGWLDHLAFRWCGVEGEKWYNTHPSLNRELLITQPVFLTIYLHGLKKRDSYVPSLDHLLLLFLLCGCPHSPLLTKQKVFPLARIGRYPVQRHRLPNQRKSKVIRMFYF